MKIPSFTKYPKGEYSLIQIAPTLDSQEIVNIGVIVKNIDTNEIEIKLFDDISKLSKRIYIENKDSLSYTFDILKKQITTYKDTFEYKNFTNAIKINEPLPISITSSLEQQTIKLFNDKVTILKTFQNLVSANNSMSYDKNFIIDNINSYINSNNLRDRVETRKYMPINLGSTRLVDTIVYNDDRKPIIVSDIISPETSKIEDMYMKSLFTLKNLSADSIVKRVFYIPDIDDIPSNISEHIKYIKENIKKEGLEVNDSKDQKEYIEKLIDDAKKVS